MTMSEEADELYRKLVEAIKYPRWPTIVYEFYDAECNEEGAKQVAQRLTDDGYDVILQVSMSYKPGCSTSINHMITISGIKWKKSWSWRKDSKMIDMLQSYLTNNTDEEI